MNANQIDAMLKQMKVSPRPNFKKIVKKQMRDRYFLYQIKKIINNLYYMRKLGTPALVATLAFVGIWTINLYNTPAYQSHVEKAEHYLTTIRDTLDNKAQSVSIFFQTAHAENNEVKIILSEGQEDNISKLAEAMVDETEAAISAAEQELTDVTRAEKALNILQKLQTEEGLTLERAIGSVNSEKNIKKLAKAIEITNDNAVEVQNEISKIIIAKTGEGKVKIEIETEDEKEVKEDNSQNQSEGKNLVSIATEKLNESRAFINSTDDENLIEKFNRAEEALEDGKFGRSYGLSTAISAKIRATIRHNEHQNKQDKETTKDASELIREENKIPENKNGSNQQKSAEESQDKEKEAYNNTDDEKEQNNINSNQDNNIREKTEKKEIIRRENKSEDNR